MNAGFYPCATEMTVMCNAHERGSATLLADLSQCTHCLIDPCDQRSNPLQMGRGFGEAVLRIGQ